MKKLFVSILFSIVCLHLSAQNISNPYASIGKKAPKVATVTNGEYEEFFTKDSLVQIGTTVMNRYTGEVAFFEEDNFEKFKQFTEHGEKNFRFLSVDPMASEYPFYTPYQFAGNTPIQATDLDGLEPDYIVTKNGKLTAPVMFIFTALLNFDKVTMQAVTITKLPDPNPSRYAETWNQNDVRTYSNSQVRVTGWVRTLGHEFKHVEQYKNNPLPAGLQRLIISINQLGEPYDSENNGIEQPARDAGKRMDAFTNRFDVDGILSNSALSDDLKIAKLQVMTETFMMEEDQKTIEKMQTQLKSFKNPTEEVTQSVQKKIDTYKGYIEGHKKNIENYEAKAKELETKETTDAKGSN